MTYLLQRLSLRRFSLWAIALTAVFLVSSVFAQETDFPVLSGRVVDQAQLLDAQAEASLTATLEAHETETTNQVVVVTLASLNGNDIIDYANRLGRHWGIGTSEEDNGVLLVVAPNERKVRIEVGYGLEGALTDSLSSMIIQREILPEFKKGDFPTGISQGTTAILQAIKGEYTAPSSGADGRKSDAFSEQYGNYVPLIFIAIIGIPELLRRRGYKKASRGAFPAGFGGLFATIFSGSVLIGIAVAIAAFLLVYFKGSSGGGPRPGGYIGTGGMGGSGGFGGGGFGGGGGSFGGGGASGSW